MKIGILTATDARYAPVAAITGPVNTAYVDAHGYERRNILICDELTWAETVWEKIPMLRKYLSDYDWLMWIDADAMVMNHRVKIEDLIAKCPLDTDLIISSDLHGLNAGVFLLRNRQWARDFLQSVDESKPEFISHRYPEQEAMNAILKDFNGKNGDYPVSYLPQWLLNQFWLQWIPGDFIIHHSGGSVEDKVKGLTPFLSKVEFAR